MMSLLNIFEELTVIGRAISVWMLCACRVLPLALFVPLFFGLPATRWIRVGFAIVLGIALSLMLGLLSVPGAARFDDLSLAGFLLTALGECLVGAMLALPIIIGFAAINAAMSSVWVMAGETRGNRVGDEAGSAPDPIAMLVGVLALASLSASGGLRFMVQGLAQTFQDVPLGAIGLASRTNPTGVLESFGVTGDSVVNAAGQLFLSTLLIAGPMYLTLVLVEVAMVVLSRVAGRLDGSVTGSAIKPIVVTLAAAMTLTAVLAAVGQLSGIPAA